MKKRIYASIWKGPANNMKWNMNRIQFLSQRRVVHSAYSTLPFTFPSHSSQYKRPTSVKSPNTCRRTTQRSIMTFNCLKPQLTRPSWLFKVYIKKIPVLFLQHGFRYLNYREEQRNVGRREKVSSDRTASVHPFSRSFHPANDSPSCLSYRSLTTRVHSGCVW